MKTNDPGQMNAPRDTLREKFNFYRYLEEIKGKMNWLQKALNLITRLDNFMGLFKSSVYKRSRFIVGLRSVTQDSFDNGKTWNNLKVIDHSGKHRHLFKCNIDGLEHCSFQTCLGYGPMESKTGIFVRKGTVGKYYDVSKHFQCMPYKSEKDMTFILRDGGVSWELTFDFAARVERLDFDNIIIPEDSDTYIKFFSSSDQGMTWEEYHFNEPIHASYMSLSSRGLKIYMGCNAFKKDMFNSFNKKTGRYVYYSVDFSDVFNRTACTENDWETWYVSNGNCIDGKKYSLDRRKPDAKCLMEKTFEKLELHEEACDM